MRRRSAPRRRGLAGEVRLLPVPDRIQERRGEAADGHGRGGGAGGRAHRRHLPRRHHRPGHGPRRAALPPELPQQRQGARARLLPRRRVRRGVGVQPDLPRLPQHPRRQGRRGGRVGELPPRAGEPAAGGVRGLVGGAQVGALQLGVRLRPVAVPVRRPVPAVPRRRQRRRQHRAQPGAARRRGGPAGRRRRRRRGGEDQGRGAAGPVLPGPQPGRRQRRGPGVPAVGGEDVELHLRGEVPAGPPLREPAGAAGGEVGQPRVLARAGDGVGAGPPRAVAARILRRATEQRVAGAGGALRNAGGGARLLPHQARHAAGAGGDGHARRLHQPRLVVTSGGPAAATPRHYYQWYCCSNSSSEEEGFSVDFFVTINCMDDWFLPGNRPEPDGEGGRLPPLPGVVINFGLPARGQC